MKNLILSYNSWFNYCQIYKIIISSQIIINQSIVARPHFPRNYYSSSRAYVPVSCHVTFNWLPASKRKNVRNRETVRGKTRVNWRVKLVLLRKRKKMRERERESGIRDEYCVTWSLRVCVQRDAIRRHRALSRRLRNGRILQFVR